MTVEMTDAPARHRYEARAGQGLLGFAQYQKTPDLVVFTHTTVESRHEGHGAGGALVHAAVDGVRSQDLAVLPLRPVVHRWIQRHPGYADLLHDRPATTARD